MRKLSIAPMHYNPFSEASTECNSQTVDFDQADPYFDSYSHFYIHEEMLRDTVRTRTYQ